MRYTSVDDCLSFPDIDPYFAITAKHGSFEIDDVPSDEHLAWLWHKELGELERKAVVGADAQVDVDFRLGNNGSE